MITNRTEQDYIPSCKWHRDTMYCIGDKREKLTILGMVRSDDGRNRYVCQCDCGNKTEVRLNAFGITKSCGCITAAMDPKEAAFGVTYSNYKSRAKKDGKPWSLSKEYCRALFAGNCHYCGSPPACQINGWMYNGIDRMNNDKSVGYCVENAVSCCYKCNVSKGDMSYDDFILWLKRTSEYMVPKLKQGEDPYAFYRRPFYEIKDITTTSRNL